MHTNIDCFHSCGQHLCKFLGTKEGLKKRMLQPLQDCFGAPTVSLFWDIIMPKMADVASYINALFVTISFIRTGQKVIIITINSKKGHSIN